MKKTERTRDGYRQLSVEAYKQCKTFAEGTPYRLICSAEQNADDTMLEEGFKSWHESDDSSERWMNYFFLTLEALVCDRTTPKATRSWFERRGIIG